MWSWAIVLNDISAKVCPFVFPSVCLSAMIPCVALLPFSSSSGLRRLRLPSLNISVTGIKIYKKLPNWEEKLKKTPFEVGAILTYAGNDKWPINVQLPFRGTSSQGAGEQAFFTNTYSLSNQDSLGESNGFWQGRIRQTCEFC